MGRADILKHFLPIARAISQLDDPVFRGVLLRGIAWSVGSFIALHVGVVWVIGWSTGLHSWLRWTYFVIGMVLEPLLTLWLFLPVAAAIGTLYFDRVASSVERRFYPLLPPPKGASFLEQAWDGVVVALKVLGLNALGLILAPSLPGIGLILGWLIAAYAIGRGLFAAVAMRRKMAESTYPVNRGPILLQGAVMALVADIQV